MSHNGGWGLWEAPRGEIPLSRFYAILARWAAKVESNRAAAWIFFLSSILSWKGYSAAVPIGGAIWVFLAEGKAALNRAVKGKRVVLMASREFVEFQVRDWESRHLS